MQSSLDYFHISVNPVLTPHIFPELVLLGRERENITRVHEYMPHRL